MIKVKIKVIGHLGNNKTTRKFSNITEFNKYFAEAIETIEENCWTRAYTIKITKGEIKNVKKIS